MSWRRNYFTYKLSKNLELEEGHIIVLNIEKGVFNDAIDYCNQNNEELDWLNKTFLKRYSTSARRILSNTSYTTNAKQFKKKIVDGELDPYDIVNMTHEQMNPEFWSNLKVEIMKKHISKDKEEVPDGMFKCNSCKSKKTIYYQIQTRSADEPMTTYVTCTNCNKRWKC